MSNQDFDGDDLEIEARARNMGWVPEEEWDEERAARDGRRKPANFKTADQYIKDTEASFPMMRAQNRNLSAEVDRLKGQVGEIDDLKGRLDETGKLVDQLHNANKEVGQRAYAKGREDRLNEMEEAAAEGDEEKAKAARAGLEALEAARDAEAEAEAKALAETRTGPAAPEPPADESDFQKRQRERRADPTVNPDTQSWLDGNEWFERDTNLNRAMVYEHGQVQAESPAMSVREALDEAKRRVEAKYPKEFGVNPNRDAPGSVHRPAPPHDPGSADRTFAQLPQEDKDNFKRMQNYMKEKGEEYTEKEFLAEYQWS